MCGEAGRGRGLWSWGVAWVGPVELGRGEGGEEAGPVGLGVAGAWPAGSGRGRGDARSQAGGWSEMLRDSGSSGAGGRM